MPGLHGEILEKWRLVDVIAFFIPLINVARARWNFVPLRILTGKIAIELTESFRGERGLHDVPDFAESRPEIAKKRFVAVLVFSDRVAREIDMDPTGQGEGDNQRRRHQEIRFDMLMHARFEIAIARKN